MKLNGKSVLITGAKGGLGSFVTERFLAEGALVTGVSRSIAGADFPHDRFVAISSDLANLQECQRVIGSMLEHTGHIDALVHLVGGFSVGPDLPELSDEALSRMLHMNFYSAFHVIRAVLPAMQAACSGSIVAIGSRSALEPPAGQSAYAASKAALISLVRSVATENRAIRANVVLPGTLDTAANRLAMPDADFANWTPPAEVAAMLAHLASDDAAHLTGAVIPIDRTIF